MKVMVTGAGGFVGTAVVASALSAGHEVVALIRPSGKAQRLAGLGVAVVPLNLADADEVAAAMRHYRPDAVVHSAWSGVANATRNDRSQIDENLTIALALVDGAIASGVEKFVGIGSQAEYGLLSGKIRETALPAPNSLYGAAKVAVQVLAAQLCAEAGVAFAWLRLFSAYGPGDNPNWLIPSIIEQMLDGNRPRTTEGRQLWDYLYVDDVGDAVRAVLESPDATGVFNLGSGQPVPVRQIVEQIRDAAWPGSDLVFGEIAYGPQQIWHMEADIERLTRLSGFIPKIDMADGIARTVAWHRSLRRP